MRFNLAQKINLLVSSVIVIFTFLLGFYFSFHEKKALDSEFDERIIAIMELISDNSRYPVLIGNIDAVSNIVHNVLIRKDIVFCRIEDKDGNLLFQEGFRKEKLTREYSSPIFVEKAVKADERVILGAAEREKEKIGQIILSASLLSIEQKMKKVNKTILLSSIIVIVFASFFNSLFIKLIFSKSVKKLVDGTKRIAKGDLNYIVPIKSSDELGELADSFNKMTEDLNKSRNALLELKDNEIKFQTAVAASEKEKINILQESKKSLEEKTKKLTESRTAMIHMLESLDRKSKELADIIENLNFTQEQLVQINKELLERNEQLERFNRVTVGRELDMVKLKEEINSLLEKSGQPGKYEAPGKIKEIREKSG